MKLYYSPGACSLSPNILAEEAGLKLELVKVDLANKKTENGEDFLKINPKGYVPALQTDEGELITEGIAIDLYLSSLNPKAKLTPQPGDKDYLNFLSHLVFISTEMHKGIGSLFAGFDENGQKLIKKKLAVRLAYLASHLKSDQYIFNNQFSALDAYLYTVLSWAPKVGVDLSEYPVIGQYLEFVGKRPSIQKALEAEGLTKKKAA